MQDEAGTGWRWINGVVAGGQGSVKPKAIFSKYKKYKRANDLTRLYSVIWF